MSDQPLTILHTGAHPADAFDLAGGTLAHHIRRGDKVTVVVFTHGSRSHNFTEIEARRRGGKARQLEEVIDEKQCEVREACAVLGITDVRFLPHDDHALLMTPANIRAMATVIRDVRPDVIITHSPYESGTMSSAHKICADITLQGKSMAGGLMEGNDQPPHKVGEIFFVHTHGETTCLDYAFPRFPEILIDVTDVIELKVKALDCIKSQYYAGAVARKMYELVNGVHGLHRCMAYCETFFRYYPQAEHYLPVSEHNLNLARRPLAETYARSKQLLTVQVPLAK